MASTDRDVLLVLHQSTGGASWKNKVNWGTGAPVSQWHGVKVNDQGRVVKLVMINNNLRGTIPEELGKLTALKKLKLNGNNLSGPIPPELGALRELKTLELNNNQLTGPIPAALGALSELEKLWLFNNKLTGTIPRELGKLAALVYLYLNSNGLTGSIPRELGGLSKLERLWLSNNKLTGAIPPELGQLGALLRLELWRNALSGPIPPELGALRELKTLELNNNQLTGTIPRELGKLTALIELYLNDNGLTGTIPRELGKLTALVRLYLNSNGLTGTVPLGVWKLPRVEAVDISNNLLTHFTDPDEEIAPAREVLSCLKRVERMESTKSFSYGNYFVDTDGNPWEFPPAAVAAKGLESILRYYDTWEQCDFSLVEINALKVVFVGAFGAGKTSLARSIRKGRGDRTPETDENMRTTVGVDLVRHKLRNGTECKIYDVAGQISYYGLHQYFLTERAVYVIVWDVTRFEGLSGQDLDQAIGENILEWVSLLHMRTPVCTVMLVASHFDMLVGSTPEDNKQLLVVVEKRFLELHTDWKKLRRRQNANMDQRMTILPGVFPVGCKLESESASRATANDGLQAIDEALSKQASVASRVPPSWVAARRVLEEVGSVHDDSSGDDSTAVSGRRRPWELRSVLQAAFKTSLEESRNKGHPEPWLSRLPDVGIRDSMEGAIEMRAFSGTLISHDVFIVLDVVWLAGVLKPILDHRGVIQNNEGQQTFANRALTTAELFCWANELVGRGILRKGFARFLWNLDGQGVANQDDPHEIEPAEFEKILQEIGVTIPLPDRDGERGRSPAAPEVESPGDAVSEAPRRDAEDLLVIMRLSMEANAATRENLEAARQAAFASRGSSGGGNSGLRVLFEFDHAGAPHGLPERVMALSHKIGRLSSTARWRLGGLFLLHEDGGKSGSSRMILEYDKTRKTFGIEALGQTALDFGAIGFVISALFYVANDFPGVGWAGWVECGMGHDGQKMYHLAPSDDKQNHKPGSRIIPLIRSSRSEEWDKQENGCGRLGMDPRGPCTVDPDAFGMVLDTKLPYPFQDGREAEDVNTPSAVCRDVNPRCGGCREAYDFVFKPLSGKIASTFLGLSAGFFIAATALDDGRRAVLGLCYAFAALCLLVALVAAYFFAKEKVAEGRIQERPSGADQRGPSPPFA